MWMTAMIISIMQLMRECDSVYKVLFKPGKYNLKIIAWGGMIPDTWRHDSRF